MSTWTTVLLGEVASVFNGKTPSRSEQRTEGHPVLKVRDVNSLGDFHGKFGSFVTSEFAGRFANKHVRSGDTLILNAAHNAEYVASKTYRAQPPTFDSLATGEWLIIRPNDGVLHPDFVYHWVNAPKTARIIRELVNGIHLYPKDVARVSFSIPSLSEQRRIATVLDHAETLRAKRREAVTQFDELAQSIFLDMFGNPLSNKKGWPAKSLIECCHCYSGGTPSKADSKLWHGTLPWFSAKDLKSTDLYDSQDHISVNVPTLTTLKLLPANTVTLVARGMILAHTVPVSTLRVPATINQDLKALLPIDPLEPQFLAACVRSQSNSILQQVSAAAHGTKKIDAHALSTIRVILPSLDIQQEFARRVETVAKLKASQRAHLAALNALFTSLQYRTFRGEL